MGHYKLLEHTADIGIEARAEEREGLAEQSGHGLCFLLFGDQRVDGDLNVTITAGGDTPEETLVNWLNELLFVLIDRNLIASHINIRHFNEQEISAVMRGEHLDPDQHQVLREIKAATHHQCQVGHNGEQWQSRVYLDL